MIWIASAGTGAGWHKSPAARWRRWNGAPATCATTKERAMPPP